MDSTQVLKEFPAVKMFTFVVQTDAYSEVMYGMFSLSAMKTKYNVSSELSDSEAIEVITNAMNQELEAQNSMANVPSAEERIAAMLEYQTLSSMNDI